ncbi:MAG: hypothetical protein ACJ761_09835 [Chloroflexota bacterium]
MQILTSTGPSTRRVTFPLVAWTVAGTLLVVTGIWLGYMAFGTPLLGTLLSSGRVDSGRALVNVFTWTLFLAGPAACLMLGASRLAVVIATARGRRGPRSAVARHAGRLTGDVLVAMGVEVGDGRPIPELVVGPFGAAVIRELPPPDVTRHSATTWELRTRAGWIPLENPLDRAARDAERVRRWFEQGDDDFIVKVYAAVLTKDITPARTPACAVVPAEQVSAWLGSLPVQRSLTQARRDRIVDRIRHSI